MRKIKFKGCGPSHPRRKPGQQRRRLVRQFLREVRGEGIEGAAVEIVDADQDGYVRLHRLGDQGAKATSAGLQLAEAVDDQQVGGLPLHANRDHGDNGFEGVRIQPARGRALAKGLMDGDLAAGSQIDQVPVAGMIPCRGGELRHQAGEKSSLGGQRGHDGPKGFVDATRSGDMNEG